MVRSHNQIPGSRIFERTTPSLSGQRSSIILSSKGSFQARVERWALVSSPFSSCPCRTQDVRWSHLDFITFYPYISNNLKARFPALLSCHSFLGASLRWSGVHLQSFKLKSKFRFTRCFITDNIISPFVTSGHITVVFRTDCSCHVLCYINRSSDKFMAP